MRRWWLVVLPTLVALVLTLPALRASLSPPVSYLATIRFTASPKPGSGGTFQDQSYTPWLASEYAVNNLATWMRTDSFAREVSTALDTLGKKVEVERVRGLIANSDSARSLMTLYLRGPDADELKTVGQAAINVLADKTDAYFPQVSAQKTLVVPLDQVLPVLEATPITARFAPLVRVGIGLALGLVLAFLAEYLDRSVRSRSDLETLGLPVIAEIPRHKG